MMIQINADEIVPVGNTISAKEYQAYISGEEIIAQAHRRAQQIIDEAEKKAESLERDGYQRGIADGQAEMSEKMLESIDKYVDYLGSMEGQIVAIVSKAIRKIVGELNQDELIVRVVGNALSIARDQAKAKLRVCPSDLQNVQARLDEILRPYPSVQFVDVVSDSRLSAGGCILETDVGVVDASIDVQVSAIEKRLAKSLGGAQKSAG